VFLLWYSSTNFSRLFPNVLVTFVIICYFCSFSLVDRASFENVSRRWVPEIRQYAPHTPFILVGNKLDQREKECTSHIDQTNNNTNTYHTDEQRVDQSEVISALSRTHRYSKILRLLERNNRSRIYSIPNPILPHFAKRNSETTQKKKKRLSFAFFKTLYLSLILSRAQNVSLFCLFLSHLCDVSSG
jgi:GTPase SAR1 family protein